MEKKEPQRENECRLPVFEDRRKGPLSRTNLRLSGDEWKSLRNGGENGSNVGKISVSERGYDGISDKDKVFVKGMAGDRSRGPRGSWL
jgi:hypothetical protein